MTYVLLILAALLCEVSSNIPLGSLPLALVSEGASESHTAIAMGCGMFAALLVSLPVGMLVDRIGRVPVLRASAFCSVLVMIAMGLTHGIIAGCLQMAFRSAVLTAYLTAQLAYVSNIFPKDRAVSAAGTMGILGNVAFATGPAFGVWLWQHGVHREQYVGASALNFVAALLVMRLPEKFDIKTTRRRRRHIFFRPAWLPAMVFVLCFALMGGVNGSLAVLTFQARGIPNGALIFTAAAIGAGCLRYPAGRMVEIYGPRLIAIPTAIAQALGCLIASQAHQSSSVIVAGGIMGLAWSAVVPIGLALLFESSSHRTRGTAMGSFNLALGGGAALGALVATLATMFGAGYQQATLLCAFMPCLALSYLFYSRPKRKNTSADSSVQTA